jgi:FkbM family methyltransferase
MVIKLIRVNMQFSTLNLVSINRQPPPDWKRMWYGYFQMEKVISQEKKRLDTEAHKLPLSNNNLQKEILKGEDYIEQQFFLNIISSLKGHVTLIELGAGRGDWCLALAGIVDFNLIYHRITSYKCIGVEAEPTHFEWMKTHFEEQRINAIAVQGAIASKNGECKFYSITDPASNYGQAVREDGNLTVSCYTIDYLMNQYSLNGIDILHADVQGSEYDMLLGATGTLKNQTIKYMIIGTHKPGINEQIIEYVKPYNYETLFSINVKEGPCNTPFGKAYFPVDGLLILKSKEI